MNHPIPAAGDYVKHFDPELPHHRAWLLAVLEQLVAHEPQALEEGGTLRRLWTANQAVVGAGPAPVDDIPAAVAVALPLVKEFEGCRLTAYPDPETGGEPWTIGWGSTSYPDGKAVQAGETISQELADALLAGRLERDWRSLRDCIPLYKALSVNQQAALLSLLSAQRPWPADRLHHGPQGLRDLQLLIGPVGGESGKKAGAIAVNAEHGVAERAAHQPDRAGPLRQSRRRQGRATNGTTAAIDRTTQPIAVSSTSRLTCPSSCPLAGNQGCYAEAGLHTRLHWDRLSRGESGSPAAAFIRQVMALPAGGRSNKDPPSALPSVTGDEPTSFSTSTIVLPVSHPFTADCLGLGQRHRHQTRLWE